jgi:hypothetical protein
MNEELTEEQEWEILWQMCLEMEKKIYKYRNEDETFNTEEDVKIYQLNDPRYLK